MNLLVKNLHNTKISCANCQACCCSSEVMIVSETGVPDKFIHADEYGNESMIRLEDGWCAALDRDTLLCTIYENRPWICREFAEGSYDCRNERKTKMHFIK